VGYNSVADNTGLSSLV